MNNVEVIAIPVPDLVKGMRTYRRNPRNGRLQRDVTLGDPYIPGGHPVPFAFYTVGANGKRTGIAVYSRCATVLVETGRKAVKVSAAARKVGRAQRNQAR